MRCTASATIFFASRSALRLARLADLAKPVGRVGLRLLLHAPDQLGLRLVRRTGRRAARGGGAPRPPASRAPAARSSTDFSLRPRSLARLPTSLSRCSSSSNLRSSTISRSWMRVFLALDFLAAAAGLALPFLAGAHRLFLAGEHGLLAEPVGLALGVADDALDEFFGGVAGGLPGPNLACPVRYVVQRQRRPRNRRHQARRARSPPMQVDSWSVCSKTAHPRCLRGAPQFMKTARERASSGRSTWVVRPAGRAPSKGAERVGLTTEAACTYVLAAPRSSEARAAPAKRQRDRLAWSTVRPEQAGRAHSGGGGSIGTSSCLSCESHTLLRGPADHDRCFRESLLMTAPQSDSAAGPARPRDRRRGGGAIRDRPLLAKLRISRAARLGGREGIGLVRPERQGHPARGARLAPSREIPASAPSTS